MISSALGSKTEATKMEKTKIIIAMEVLNKVLVEFPKTKEFINEKLEQKYSKDNISLKEVISFSLTSQVNTFYCAVSGFSKETWF